MEQLILEVYEEEFKRLGPSAVRFVERQLQGYLRYKDSSDPLLSKRAQQYRERCVDALPLFPVTARYAPSREVAVKAKEIKQAIIEHMGSGGVMTRIKTMIVPALAIGSRVVEEIERAEPERAAAQAGATLATFRAAIDAAARDKAAA